MEREAWAGTHYVLFNEPETGRRSDVVMGYQLDGECIAAHGLPGVFRRRTGPDDPRYHRAHERGGIALRRAGLLASRTPPTLERGTGTRLLGAQGVAPVGTIMLAMTYLYRGRRRVRHGSRPSLRAGDPPARLVRELATVIGGTEGPRGGFDYYQNMMLWALPSAIEGGDLAGPCVQGGWSTAVLAAARGPSEH